MKTKEELNTLKEEVENVRKKLHELTDEELEQVLGGYSEAGVSGDAPHIRIRGIGTLGTTSPLYVID